MVNKDQRIIEQIFKTSIAVTGTAKESAMYGGSDLLIERAVKGTEHMEQIEKTFWLSEKKQDTTDHYTRTTGGILELINGGNSFVQNQGGVLTAPDFNNFLREGFTYGSPKKILFAGGLVLAAVNEFARGQIQTAVGQSSYGVKVSSYMTAFGDITMVHHPLFIGELAGYGFLLDLNCFKIRPLRNRDTRLELNVQAPDVDGEIDQYITETGLERRQAPRHALLKGVTQS